MPTTIYDSSLLTIRKRDNIIAQSVINRNNNANQIIIPQTGYPAYTISNVANGSISYITRNSSGKEIIQPACLCFNSNSNSTTNKPTGDIELFYNSNISPNISFTISGNGTIVICFGDGSPLLTYINPVSESIAYTYTLLNAFTVSIYGTVTSLVIP